MPIAAHNDRADDEGGRVGPGEGGRTRRAVVAAKLQRDARVDRPDEERAEQQHAACVAVRDEMRERPQRHRGEQRVAQPAADLARRLVHAGERDEGEPHQRQGHIARPLRRRPDLVPGVGAVADEAPDDQRQTGCGDERMQPPVGVGADPFDHAPARPAQAGEHVDAEHHDEAERENEHAVSSWRREGAIA